MTRTFCDICGEELENLPEKHNPTTTYAGFSFVKDKSFNYRISFWIGSSTPIHLCRKCVLEAVRYIADNK